MCDSVLGDDVVVRLRKVQIMNSSGKEETAITAYLVSDGIDQCCVGFLHRHFAAHARSFDGVLAQVTEVYSITSASRRNVATIWVVALLLLYKNCQKLAQVLPQVS